MRPDVSRLQRRCVRVQQLSARRQGRPREQCSCSTSRRAHASVSSTEWIRDRVRLQATKSRHACGSQRRNHRALHHQMGRYAASQARPAEHAQGAAAKNSRELIGGARAHVGPCVQPPGRSGACRRRCAHNRHGMRPTTARAEGRNEAAHGQELPTHGRTRARKRLRSATTRAPPPPRRGRPAWRQAPARAARAARPATAGT